jgi:hypothetical protein
MPTLRRFIMTMPNERRMAVLRTEDFLMDLCIPSRTPRIPKEIRERARSLLRHYPTQLYMDIAKEQAPKVFGEWDS